MEKIAIVTITIVENIENAYNYGNKLQMFALQEYLRTLGHSCDTIKYQFSPPVYSLETSKKNRDFSLVQIFDDGVRILNRKRNKKRLTQLGDERRKKFDLFVEKNISMTTETYTIKSNFKELGTCYDHYIVGSDQVWNPYCEGSNEFYYLTFAPKEKRIAYAPSIGVDNIPDQILAKYVEWIKGFDKLSIREDTGKKLLKDKIGVTAQMVCDPVFLLNRDQWEAIAIKTKVEESYFVCYFLGKKTVEIKRKIKYLEKITGLKCIDMYSKDYIKSAFAGPEEFVGLIAEAKFICTDSFHGTAFATIFDVPMIVFERVSEHQMNSRIESLLRIVGINNRSIDDIMDGKAKPDKISRFRESRMDSLIFESKRYLVDALNER